MRRTLSIAGGVFLGIMAVIVALVVLSRPASGWEVGQVRDPMTDMVTHQAHLLSDDGRAQIELACQRGEPVQLYVKAPIRLGGYTDATNFVERMVRYRFDQGNIVDAVGVLGDDLIGFREAKPGDRWDSGIIAGLTRSKRLVIETASERGERVTMAFDVDGGAKTIARLMASCQKA